MCEFNTMYMYVCKYIYINKIMHASLYTDIKGSIPLMYVCIYIYIHTYVCVYICIHKYTYAHYIHVKGSIPSKSLPANIRPR
jgi:hypothetical protein